MVLVKKRRAGSAIRELETFLTNHVPFSDNSTIAPSIRCVSFCLFSIDPRPGRFVSLSTLLITTDSIAAPIHILPCFPMPSTVDASRLDGSIILVPPWVFPPS